MENSKRIMLNMHIWTSVLDLLVSSLLTPYMFLPAMCGITVGILSWLGVPIVVQVFLAQCGLAGVGVSLVIVFENRHNVVATDRFVIKGKAARIVFYSLNCIYGCLFMTPTYFSIPDQEKTKVELLKIIPCPTPLYFESNVFVLMNHEGRAFIQAQCTTFFCVLVLQGAFFVTRTVYFLTVKNPSLSEKTRQMQRKFFRSVCIQVAIPVFIVILPLLYCGSAIEWYYYNQAFSNTAIICVSFHGMSSTLAILFIYEPYRNYTKQCFSRMFRRKTSSPATPKNVSVTPKQSTTTTSRRAAVANVQT
uniref:Serpentine Receptor, class H n=1 Tax=Caenorhabditis tropicalis TaxID=1561998 RepID=A0A1I7T8B5_9PELO